MKQTVSIGVGALIGAFIGVIAMHFVGGNLPISRIDVFSFVMTTLALLVGVFTVIGAVAVVNTWNDIDKKGREITDREVGRFNEQANAKLKRFDEITELNDEKFKAVATSQEIYLKLFKILHRMILSVLALVLLVFLRFFYQDMKESNKDK